MSTILDALRKVEADNHARSPDARARLLFSLSQSDLHLARRPRAPLLIMVGFVLAGFAAGAGLMLWGPHSRSVEEGKGTGAIEVDQGLKPLVRATEDTLPAPPVAPAERPPLSPAVAVAIPSSALSAGIAPPARALAPELDQAFFAVDTPVVHRSPFVIPSPVKKEVAPTAKSARVPSPPAPEAQNGPLYEVLAPSGATRVTESPPSASANTAVPADTALSFLQWSPEQDNRIAFIRVKGGPLTLAHEGDTVGGFTVVEIRPDAVELRSGETRLTLRVQ